MVQEDELIADLVALVDELVADGSVELATKNGARSIAADLAAVIEETPDVDLEAWLLDRDEVVEIFVDRDALATRLRPVVSRLVHGDPEGKWNDELGSAIARDPTDDTALRVFGDWLHEASDPRGELLIVQMKLAEASDAERSLLSKREQTLFERYRVHFFGPLANEEKRLYRIRWRAGFFDELEVAGGHVEALSASLSFRLLRRLTVSSEVDRFAEALSRRAIELPISLERLQLRQTGKHHQPSTQVLELALKPGDGAGLTRRELGGLPKLTELEITHDKIAVSSLVSPTLKRLAIYGGELAFASPIAVDLPALEELIIASTTVTGGAALLDLFAEPPPRLKRLRLGTRRDSFWPRLLESPLMPKLEELDLRGSETRPGMVDTLISNRDRLKHLSVLDLRRHWLPAARLSELSAICKEVRLGTNDPDRAREDGYDDGEEEDEYDDDEGYEWDDPVPNEDEFEGDEEREEESEDDDNDGLRGVGEDIPEPLRRDEEPDDDPDATPFIERYERTEE